jgi:hypothetical protein
MSAAIKPRIGVVGSNMVDLVTYVNRMPTRGETVEAPSFEMGHGGKGANQAVAAAMLGASVVMVTAVGEDMFADATMKNFDLESTAGMSNGSKANRVASPRSRSCSSRAEAAGPNGGIRTEAPPVAHRPPPPPASWRP